MNAAKWNLFLCEMYLYFIVQNFKREPKLPESCTQVGPYWYSTGCWTRKYAHTNYFFQYFFNFFHIRLHQPLGNSFRYNGKSSQQRLVRSFVIALSSFGLHNIVLLSVIKIQYITFMLDSHFISFVTCLYGPCWNLMFFTVFCQCWQNVISR